MTTINVSNLILTLQQKIDSSTNETDILYYSKAIQQLRSTNVFVVNNLSDLPNAQQNPGLLYYVKSEEMVYFSSPFGWIEIYNSVASTIFSWGLNSIGVLGDGTIIDKCVPTQEASFSTDWCQVDAGDRHTAAIKKTGQLWSWGCGNAGLLGDGTTTTRCSPVRERCSATDWCMVSAGCYHTNAIKTTGELWSWGNNAFGRLGDGTTTSRCSPVREMSSATDWCQVSAGYRHSAAIKTTGQLWAWGEATCGILANASVGTSRCSPIRELCSDTNWCQVSAGTCSTAAIKTSGQLWTWGNGGGGRLGDGTTVSKCSPVREFCSATDWCQVSANYCRMAAIKTTGELWAWGQNNSGTLGDGTVTARCSPVREFCSATDWCGVSAGGERHTAAIKTSGQIWAWGCNLCGRLGDGTTVNTCSPVREFCSATDWCQVSAGFRHTTAIRTPSL